MVTITQGEWIADLGAMLCRNINNGIIVCFEMTGKSLSGKIKDMPVELMEQWAKIPNGHELVRKTVMEAEDLFLKAYFLNSVY